MIHPKLQDMALTPKEMAEDSPMGMIGSHNMYPYGLCICLCDDQLEKLKLDSDCEVGDFLHIFAMAKVTSVSKNDTGDGEKTRIELQITHMGLESEDAEDEEEDTDPKPTKKKIGNMYKREE